MKKIMIVDDEQISLMMTENILKTQYETICAASGNEAIQLYFKEMPDMILSDLRMPPGMSGYELQQELQQRTGSSIPFMFMTADHDDETESKGFANGALDFIRKPFRPDVLLRRIGNILATVEQIKGLRHAAVTDPMTGLLNKASSQEEIGILCQSTPGILMMIDLDSFKPVNDIYGHEMGDKILIRFAEIIKSAMRNTDLIGRMGGDEFIAYCQNVRSEQVIAKKTKYINEEILASARELMGEDMSIPLGASIGCVIAPDEGINFSELYKKADRALYQVKENGKHGYSFYHGEDHSQSESPQEGNATDLANLVKLLSERSPSRGAFSLPFAQFSIVYQFLTRVRNIAQHDIWILLFNVSELGPVEKEDREKAIDTFFAALHGSLRASDVVTQNSRSQFLVLLFDTELQYIELILDRIMKNWDAANDNELFDVSYELDQVK